jgi:hypothetical protein
MKYGTCREGLEQGPHAGITEKSVLHVDFGLRLKPWNNFASWGVLFGFEEEFL